MNKSRRESRGDYYVNNQKISREKDDDWMDHSYGEMGLNDDDYEEYGNHYNSPTRTTVPSTPPSSAGGGRRRRQQHQFKKKINKNNKDDEDRSPVVVGSSPSASPGGLARTPLGSMTKKLLKSPGTIKRMLLSSGKQRRRKSNGGCKRKSLQEVQGDDLLSNPKLYDQLNDDDKGKLNILLSKEFGLDPL